MLLFTPEGWVLAFLFTVCGVACFSFAGLAGCIVGAVLGFGAFTAAAYIAH